MTVAASAATGCSTGARRYEEALAEMGRALETEARGERRLRELVRYATLAASNHNAQPWKFRLAVSSITIEADLTRRTPVVDPDDHHLFVSLGCATENLVHAALASGLHSEVGVLDDSIEVALDETSQARSELFNAIPHRQCSRSIYDGRRLSTEELRALAAAAEGHGVEARFFTSAPDVETVLDYVVRANAAQIANRAFVSELRRAIRFNEAHAVATRDGLFSRASGNGEVPRWLGNGLFGVFFTAESENDKLVRQLRSSAGLVVFVAQTDGPRGWIEVGRAYQRFALQATALGICNAFVNQPVEVAAIREQFASWLTLDSRRPDLIVRFGRGPAMPRSLRRPVECVLS